MFISCLGDWRGEKTVAARDICVIYLGRKEVNRKTSDGEGNKNDLSEKESILEEGKGLKSVEMKGIYDSKYDWN